MGVLSGPVDLGFYWATELGSGRRAIVEVRHNGINHVRVYTTGRHGNSFGVDEFTDWVGPLRERRRVAKTSLLSGGLYHSPSDPPK